MDDLSFKSLGIEKRRTVAVAFFLPLLVFWAAGVLTFVAMQFEASALTMIPLALFFLAPGITVILGMRFALSVSGDLGTRLGVLVLWTVLWLVIAAGGVFAILVLVTPRASAS